LLPLAGGVLLLTPLIIGIKASPIPHSRSLSPKAILVRGSRAVVPLVEVLLRLVLVIVEAQLLRGRDAHLVLTVVPVIAPL
jgi:hypothetical protein